MLHTTLPRTYLKRLPHRDTKVCTLT